MSTELYYLGLAAALTAVMWVPYGLHMTLFQGLMVAVGNREKVPLGPAWAERAKRAHNNACQNLVVFAPLVVVVNLTGAANDITMWASTIYFWVLVAYYVVYIAGIPFLRTLIWTVGWVCLLALASQVIL